MANYKFQMGDCLELLKDLPENSIETCITDPPYGITFMGRDWDKGLPSVEIWAEVLRVMKPGGTLLSFGGTRTFHRLACNIEDAGWDIRDCISWMYGTGFPKSLNIAKTIEKSKRGFPQGGPDPTSPNHGKYKGGCSGDSPTGQGFGAGPGKFMNEEGEKDCREVENEWVGFGTALKPAWEPIIVAMKPIEGTFAQNALEHGVAGVNIDAARIPHTTVQGGNLALNPHLREKIAGGCGGQVIATEEDRRFNVQHTEGRWPANVMLSHHPDCEYKGTKKIKAITGGGGVKTTGTNVYGTFKGHKYEGKLGYFDEDGMEEVDAWSCHPDCPIRLLDEQTGTLKSGTGAMKKASGEGYQGNAYGKESRPSGTPNIEYGDSGGASRFFYCAKSARSERNLGCEDLFWKKGKNTYDLIDKNTWNGLSKQERAQGNIHTTVKPVRLLEYLCKLTSTPTGGTVLDPFTGSGTTGVAAMNVGRDFIGFDNDITACIIAEARLAH